MVPFDFFVKTISIKTPLIVEHIPRVYRRLYCNMNTEHVKRLPQIPSLADKLCPTNDLLIARKKGSGGEKACCSKTL